MLCRYSFQPSPVMRVGPSFSSIKRPVAQLAESAPRSAHGTPAFAALLLSIETRSMRSLASTSASAPFADVPGTT